jgi:hypothetical protein
MEVVDYNKYENYIRMGNSANSLQDFPTPSSIGVTLHDVDKDAFTDLQGYTHRNRVRHDVYDIELGYNILSDNDLAFILNAISNEWVYIELIDKKTLTRTTHKVYASDKQFNTFRVVKDSNNNWRTIEQAFTVTLVEE